MKLSVQLNCQPDQPGTPSEKEGAWGLSRSTALKKTNILTQAGNRVRINL